MVRLPAATVVTAVRRASWSINLQAKKQLDDPKSFIALILGASWYPKAPKLAAGPAFYNSCNSFYEYLCDPKGLRIPKSNIASFFDDTHSPGSQLEDMGLFLSERQRVLVSENVSPKNLFVYYVGHGLFARGDRAYCLAVRATAENNEGWTSIRAADLAVLIRRYAPYLRRFLVFDCCFSASVFKEFQSSPLEMIHRQMQPVEEADQGTTILCSSSAHDVSLAPTQLSKTMFSNALIDVLRKGHPNLGAYFSFGDLGTLVEDALRQSYPDDWVRPEVLSPDQRKGNIAQYPLFPNPSHPRTESSDERAGEHDTREASTYLSSEKTSHENADARAEGEQQKAPHNPLALGEREHTKLLEASDGANVNRSFGEAHSVAQQVVMPQAPSNLSALPPVEKMPNKIVPPLSPPKRKRRKILRWTLGSAIAVAVLVIWAALTSTTYTTYTPFVTWELSDPIRVENGNAFFGASTNGYGNVKVGSVLPDVVEVSFNLTSRTPLLLHLVVAFDNKEIHANSKDDIPSVPVFVHFKLPVTAEQSGAPYDFLWYFDAHEARGSPSAPQIDQQHASRVYIGGTYWSRVFVWSDEEQDFTVSNLKLTFSSAQ